ncbi:hypothetical protein OQA88_2622 [Cercophora sp. LCS_1]
MISHSLKLIFAYLLHTTAWLSATDLGTRNFFFSFTLVSYQTAIAVASLSTSNLLIATWKTPATSLATKGPDGPFDKSFIIKHRTRKLQDTHPLSTILMARHGLLLLTALAILGGAPCVTARPSAQAPNPLAHADCLALSDNPSWEITDIKLALGNLLKEPFFSARVRNFAAASPDVFFSCQGILKNDETIGPQAVQCWLPWQEEETIVYPGTRVSATFDLATYKFTVDEAWVCTNNRPP